MATRAPCESRTGFCGYRRYIDHAQRLNAATSTMSMKTTGTDICTAKGLFIGVHNPLN
jgi:hypothetical protein